MLSLIQLFLRNIGGPQILIILLIILLLFGGKKIPELMRGLGRGVKAFKQGINEVSDELNAPDKETKEKA